MGLAKPPSSLSPAQQYRHICHDLEPGTHLSVSHGDIGLSPSIQLPNLLESACRTPCPPALIFIRRQVELCFILPPPPISTDTQPPSFHSCHSSYRYIRTSTFQHPNLESACSARTAFSLSSPDRRYRLRISLAASQQQERARTSLRATCRPAPLGRRRIPRASFRCRGCISAFHQNCHSAQRHNDESPFFRNPMRS